MVERRLINRHSDSAITVNDSYAPRVKLIFGRLLEHQELFMISCFVLVTALAIRIFMIVTDIFTVLTLKLVCDSSTSYSLTKNPLYHHYRLQAYQEHVSR